MPSIRSRSLVTLLLSVSLAGASVWLAVSGSGIYCDRLPSLTICATLAAFIIALCFRQLARVASRTHAWILSISLMIAAATLFADARYVLKYRGFCSQMQEQIRQMTAPQKN